MKPLWEANAIIDQAAFEAMPAEVAVLDESGLIVTVNAAWRRFAEENGGSNSTCGIGCNYLDACRAAKGAEAIDAARVIAGIESVLSGKRDRFTIEYPCASPTTPRWFLLMASPIPSADGAARPRGAIVMHVDVTSQKLSDRGRVRKAHTSLRRRTGQLLQLARALKKSNEELDQFAYVTSHDLRAPLRGIANLSRWIEEDMGDRFTPEAHEQMNLLRGRVHRMEALIDALLKYSRVGRVRIPLQHVNVNGLLEEVVDLLAAPERIKITVAEHLPTLLTQRVPLEQVFLNLIGNAIKHHNSEGGTIGVECRDIGDFFEFTVRDDGPGIAPQYHEKIFQIFQTLSARDRIEGTGMGLTIVRKLVERQGGAIRVESAEGAGAAFCFTWPKQYMGDRRR